MLIRFFQRLVGRSERAERANASYSSVAARADEVNQQLEDARLRLLTLMPKAPPQRLLDELRTTSESFDTLAAVREDGVETSDE